jgi:hypothetical protein
MYSAQYILSTKQPDGTITRFGHAPDIRLSRLVPRNYWGAANRVRPSSCLTSSPIRPRPARTASPRRLPGAGGFGLTAPWLLPPVTGSPFLAAADCARGVKAAGRSEGAGVACSRWLHAGDAACYRRKIPNRLASRRPDLP